MKKFMFIFICFLSSIAVGGNEGGGGGHPCKEDFMNTLGWIAAAVSPNLQNLTPTDIHVLSASLQVAMPATNLVLVIRESPIQNCPNTDNPIACSHPRKNQLELYCDPPEKTGWMSLDQQRKIKYVIHELLWWSPEYNDANFFYSTGVANRLLGVTSTNRSNNGETICTESTARLSQNMRQINELVSLQMYKTPLIKDVIQLLNKNADSCIANCDTEVRKKCEKAKNIVVGL
jgi:hypothetical protein